MKNIYQRINAVMKTVSYVRKDSTVVAGNNAYMAVTHDMVLAVLRPAMVEQGIVVRVEQTANAVLLYRGPDPHNDKTQYTQNLYSADFNVHFVNMDDPQDFMTVSVTSHGVDSMDKSPNKAISMAVKYALLKTFGLETGENEEGRLAEEDCSEAIADINAATTMDELQATFKMVWHMHPKSRAALTAAKDAKKKELSSD